MKKMKYFIILGIVLLVFSIMSHNFLSKEEKDLAMNRQRNRVERMMSTRNIVNQGLDRALDYIDIYAK